MIYSYKEFIPVIHPSAFIHPQAAVTGCVTIGKDVYVGPFAAIRGDFGEIIIEDGCNIQESCTIHMFPGIIVRLKENAHIGHGAIIHGSTIGKNCLIGMNSVIMDAVEMGDESVSYTHLRAHETVLDLVCRLLLEKKQKTKQKKKKKKSQKHKTTIR